MYQILKKLLLVILCLSLLSSFAFADDLTILEGEEFNTFGTLSAADYGVSSVQWAASFVFQFGIESHNFSLSSSSPSDSVRLDQAYSDCRNTATTIAIPAGTLTVNFFTNIASATSSNSGVSVSKSGNTLTVVSDGTSSPISVNVKMYSDFPSLMDFTVSASFTPSGSGGGESGGGGVFVPPVTDMNGLHGVRQALSTATNWSTYNQYIGTQQIVMELTNKGATGEAITGESTSDFISADVLAALGFNGWSWSVDSETGSLKFKSGSPGGTWLDMIFRYLTYDYYWGTRLWVDDVSGSWFGSISSSFSYLNFRVNQILDVLANDEDLAIKDATTPEREWVKDYFTGSGDKADSGKYDKLNNTGSAFKDAFAGAPDSSIADGFNAVNDNGYEFWSQAVSDDINGNSSSSSGGSRAPAYVPPDQRIVDAYSENWAQIVGGYYD